MTDTLDKETTLEKIEQPGVGFQGFMCPKSRREVSKDFCFGKCKGIGVGQCPPMTVLLALSKQVRPPEVDPFTFHVTEIINPPQQVYLMRHNPYYLYPDSIIDMNIGSAWHDKIDETRKYVQELGLEDDYIMEQNCKSEFIVNADKETHIVTLSGTPDLYVNSTKTLWDYKVVKYYYTLKYMLEGKWEDNAYMWQLNIYRTLWYSQALAMKLYCYVKDWKYNFPERYGVNHTESIQVPMIGESVVMKKIYESLEEHTTAEVSGKYRECTEEEMWNNRLRCQHYCSVSRICPQYKEYLNANKHSRKPKIKKKAMRKIR